MLTRLSMVNPAIPFHILGSLCLISLAWPPALIADESIDFNRDIRPILSDKCYACHGPDEGQREADLRLDLQESLLEDHGSGPIVVPEAPESSLLIQRIFSEDSSTQMPPEDHKKQLSPQEKQLLRDWVSQGASWQAHWSYVPPVRADIPSLPADLQHWPRNFIDQFVASRLSDEGLPPSEQADPRRLIRRLYFDITGLPPRPEEVEDFVRDSSEEHYERIVEQLLKSPHFGERLAIYWLDLVRYADTVGYHGDQDVSISPYRDYVIEAFNSNLPFDQFTREQLAGDLLPNRTQSQLIASGYNRLGMMSAEGGVQPEEYLAKYAADRVRNISTVWMGSTMGCAECHNHKYDPFTMKDFYQLASFFADIQERGLYSGANRDGNWGPEIKVPDPELAVLLAPIDQRIEQLKQELQESSPELEQAQRDWEAEQLAELDRWVTVKPTQARSNKGAKLVTQGEGAVLVSGKTPNTDSYELQLQVDVDGATAVRIEALADASLPQNGPGRAGNGNFVLTELRLAPEDSSDSPTTSPVEFRAASASIEQADANKENPYQKWAAAAAIDKDLHGHTWGWAILPNTGQTSVFVAEFQNPIRQGSYKLILEQNHDNPKHLLGKFRIAFTSYPEPLENPIRVLDDEVRRTLELAKDPSKRTQAQLTALEQHFRAHTPLLAPLRERLAIAEKQRQELVDRHTRTTLITQAVAPREMRVLPRGNWMDKSGEVVAPAVPHFLEQPTLDSDAERLNRLDLANWLTNHRNPFTARVWVNRLWKLYFGTGLSKTLDDVGSQGEAPSHPELLDTLAVEFMDSGWDTKHIIKLMVMSSTYRQTSIAEQELVRQDPFNRLLARQSRFRLDAEMIRDNALAVSDLLVRKVGGRSVKPYQPAGLLRHLNFPKRTYQQDTGMNQYRRGVYTHWQRQFLHPAMQIFDAPAREECTAERARSNTPLAALLLLNDPSYVEAARHFAENILLTHEEDESRLSWMMGKALSREPNENEKKVLMDLLASEKKRFSDAPQQAEQLITTGLSPINGQLDPIELAAWTSLARAVFNLHETITRN